MAYADHVLIRKKVSKFIYAADALVMAISFVVLLGWLTHNVSIVQVRPEYSPMKFNSAFTVLLAGIALFMLELGWRRLAGVVAALGLIIPTITLFEHAGFIDTIIDNIFVTSFIQTKAQFINRMAPNTSIALVLIHFTILLYSFAQPLRREVELALALLGSLIAALGIVSLIGYMGGVEQAHTWGTFAGMSLQAAICFVLIGCGIIASIWSKAETEPLWVPIPVAVGFIIAAVSIWLAVTSYEDIRFEQDLQLEADNIAVRTTDRLSAFFFALDRIADRWTIANGTSRNLWEPDVTNYLKAYPYLKVVEWVNRDDMLQWAAPDNDVKQLLGKKLNTDGTRSVTARKAEVTHMSQMTKAVDLAQGAPGFLYMSPVYVHDEFDGFIVSAFTLDYIKNACWHGRKPGLIT